MIEIENQNRYAATRIYKYKMRYDWIIHCECVDYVNLLRERKKERKKVHCIWNECGCFRSLNNLNIMRWYNDTNIASSNQL